MKRHIQKTGVRKFFGQDFVDLQAEPLKALDAFFAEYGACLIEGCAITEADGGTFNVAPGLVALESTDPESGVVSVRTMPFAGAKGVALPLYLVAQWTVVERAYGDGKVKPIGYDLSAVASGIAPEGAHLVVTDADGNRFVDAVQDSTHRFITDVERSKWNAVLQQAKEYAGLQADAAKTTAVGLAKGYTDQTAAAVRDELAVGDEQAVNTAKAYADRIVAALVDNSPELLNTLEELAAALGNDPEFATTVMQAIGERATMGEVNAALAGKAPAAESKSSGNCNDWNTAGKHYFVRTDAEALTVANRPCNMAFGLIFFTSGVGSQLALDYQGGVYTRSCRWDNGWTVWRTIYHSGNLGLATTAANGLMSKEDKVLLDTVQYKPNIGATCVYLGTNVGKSLNDYIGTGYGFDTRGPMLGTVLNIQGYNNLNHPAQLLLGYGSSRAMYRTRNDDTGGWSPWAEFYTTHNLKIIRGSVGANGYGSSGTGFNATPSGNLVRIGHALGSEVCFTHTLHKSAEQGLQMHIVERGDEYILVGVWGLGSSYIKVGFDFMLMPC